MVFPKYYVRTQLIKSYPVCVILLDEISTIHKLDEMGINKDHIEVTENNIDTLFKKMKI